MNRFLIKVALTRSCVLIGAKLTLLWHTWKLLHLGKLTKTWPDVHALNIWARASIFSVPILLLLQVSLQLTLFFLNESDFIAQAMFSTQFGCLVSQTSHRVGQILLFIRLNLLLGSIGTI